MKKPASAALLLIGFSSFVLAGCSGAKDRLGLTKSTPDEFAVIKRAPLEMPQDYSALPPPSPGASRPQEQKPVVGARQTVFGKALREERRTSESEAALLNQTGAVETDPEIRRTIDKEAVENAEKDRPVADKLLNWSSGSSVHIPATVVDPEKEAERLKRNLEGNKPVTEGNTPVTER